MIRIYDIRENKGFDLFDKLANKNKPGDNQIKKVVDDILDDVMVRKDAALVDYTKKFDGVELNALELKVTEEEIREAYESVSPDFIRIINRAISNIYEFHSKQLEKSWFMTEKEGVFLGQMVRPLETVGVYVPGGTAPLASSVLMSVVPACVAGVENIIVCTPVQKNGKISPEVIVAAEEAGVTDIYKVGGAQAIGAMAYGTETIPKVDKIFGPGNMYVAMAKRMVYGYCDVDMFAGPSEIAIVADETAKPDFVAADMLSQAEHDVLASAVLFTNCPELAEKVKMEIEKQQLSLVRNEVIAKSLADYSGIVITESLEESIELSNRMAPEHLELCTVDPFSLLSQIKNAGAIFMGNYSSEPLGDYFAGPNHILPTSGTARFFSPLSVRDFTKRSSVISYNKYALGLEKDDIYKFAMAEGLDAHANAIAIRFKEDK